MLIPAYVSAVCPLCSCSPSRTGRQDRRRVVDVCQAQDKKKPLRYPAGGVQSGAVCELPVNP